MNRQNSFFLVSFFILFILFGCSGDSSDDSPEKLVETCDAAINISIDQTLNKSLEISWTTTDKFDIYEIEYGPKDFQLGNGNKLSSIEKTETIENLEVNSEYEIYVRGKCAAGYGEWFGPVSATTICANGFYEGDVELKTQEEVNAFGALCYTGINGSLLINGEDNPESIVDLSPLINLTEIKGALTIQRNGQLENLTGLEGLSKIGALVIFYNYNLNSLIGFKNLEEITSIEKIGYIQPGIRIQSNYTLVNLRGFDKIKTLERLRVDDNYNLESLEGLEGLEETNQLQLVSNWKLTSLSGLAGLVSIGGNKIGEPGMSNDVFAIASCKLLTNLNGLTNLRTIDGEMYLVNNDSLLSTNGLENIELVEHLIIQHNPNLISLEGIDTSKIQFGFNMENCDKIEDFQGIIVDSENSITWQIRNCNSLESLVGLEGLKKAKGINIQENENLITLKGFDNLNYIGDLNLRVRNNPRLSDACALSNLYLNGTYESVLSVLLNEDDRVDQRLAVEDFENGTCRR